MPGLSTRARLNRTATVSAAILGLGFGVWSLGGEAPPVVLPGTVSAPVEIPFEFVNGQIVVDVTFSDGTQGSMNVDSGVYPSVIDTLVAQNLGLPESAPAGTIAGFGSRSIAYRHASLPTLALASFAIPDLPVIVTEVAQVLGEGRFLAGTLGESFFRRATVEIDYPERLIRLWEPHLPAAPAGGTLLDADVSGPTPHFGLTINGYATTGWLDTGSQSGLVLSEATARSLGLAEALAKAESVQGMGTRGSFTAMLIQVDSVRVAGTTIGDLHAVVVQQGATWVGNELWRHFVVRFDYARRLITLSRPTR